MKRPTFLQGVVVAAGLGLAASVFVAALLPFVGTAMTARIVVPCLGLAYLLYLLPQSGERAGRATVLALWGAMTFVTWWFVSSFALYLLIHAVAIWLIRALYFYSGVLPALLDLGLNGLAAAFSLGTLARTGSVFLAVWSFFLLQALFVAIPATLRRTPAPPNDGNDDFERSRRAAEAALKQLISH